MTGTRAANLYLACVAVVVAFLNLVVFDYSKSHIDQLATVGFLVVAGALLNMPEVRIEQGRLTLSGIAVTTSALLLNPLNATLVGIATSTSVAQRGRFAVLGNAVISGTIGFSGAVVAELVS